MASTLDTPVHKGLLKTKYDVLKNGIHYEAIMSSIAYGIYGFTRGCLSHMTKGHLYL